MLALVRSCAILGVDALPIRVEVDVVSGLPKTLIVGLPDSAVRESRERVFTAIRNSGFEYPKGRITVSLAPADVRKEVSAYDLPIALGILVASRQVDFSRLNEFVIMGELALDGLVKRVSGALPAALSIRGKGVGMVLPDGNAKEGAIVQGLEVYPVRSLEQAAQFLNGKEIISPAAVEESVAVPQFGNFDFKDVKAQFQAKRALEIAAAGAHNCILLGPPGSGKTMLARRLPTIMPPMTIDEKIETTKIYSVSGLLKGMQGLVDTRPFRMPHHSITLVGMVGGGRTPRPGEVSLANNGVLFMDEMPEFGRSVLELLRQPLEDGEVTIARANATLTYPARFMIVGAMNPCPCGHRGDPSHPCVCSQAAVSRYMARLSGPLMDRFDLHLEVPPLKYRELAESEDSESSDSIRGRVINARQVQNKRFDGMNIHANSQMGPAELKRWCRVDRASMELLGQAVSRLGLSARAWDRVLKVSRTIADLEGAADIKSEHVAEGIGYRVLDRRET